MAAADNGHTGADLRASLLPIGVTIAAGLSVQPLLTIAAGLSQNIPTVNPSADYAAGVVWAVVLGATLFLWPVPRRERAALIGVWGIKSVVSLVFMLFYEAHYAQLDAYDYFAPSQGLSFDANLLHMGGGTGLMYVIAAVHTRWIVPSSYHALKVTCAFVGFLGIFVFYRAACVALGRRDPRLLYLLAMVPSILFWSSIVGKDPFVMLGIAIFSYGTVSWLVRGRARYLWLAILGLAFASVIRLWLAPIMAGSLFVVAMRKVPGVGWRILVLVLGGLSLVGILLLLRSYFALETMSDLAQATTAYTQGWAEGGSAQKTSIDFTDPGQLLRFLPLGIVTALLRPLPGEVLNAFGMLAGLEDLALVWLIGLAVVRTRFVELMQPVVLWALSFVLIWATVYGPISYQNLGSGVRFRLQILPVFVLLLLYLARRRSTSQPLSVAASPR